MIEIDSSRETYVRSYVLPAAPRFLNSAQLCGIGIIPLIINKIGRGGCPYKPLLFYSSCITLSVSLIQVKLIRVDLKPASTLL
jgi:hypothetical protein